VGVSAFGEAFFVYLKGGGVQSILELLQSGTDLEHWALGRAFLIGKHVYFFLNGIKSGLYFDNFQFLLLLKDEFLSFIMLFLDLGELS
jgi:hypothetical protein